MTFQEGDVLEFHISTKHDFDAYPLLGVQPDAASGVGSRTPVVVVHFDLNHSGEVKAKFENAASVDALIRQLQDARKTLWGDPEPTP